MGYKTGRVHHFLSDYESGYYYLLEWADNVTDIREQFPLDINETKEIAELINVRHPAYKGSDIVMTTDFVVTIKSGLTIARTVKFSKDLEDKRILEKFSIEQEYWVRRGVDWGIVTEKELDKVLIQNIKFFLPYKTHVCDEKIVETILSEISCGKGRLKEVLAYSDNYFELETGSSLNVFKALVAGKKLALDMEKRFSVTMNCDEISIVGAS
ncbi:TnsA endonuclease N-terminal domain-containing protein [Seleniivibrio woodruffii]|uniref:TnsA endonuclease N-terminal domain-containing protein n=1 Tax=Seleniivibrio woodruffii TaxID=1078050 RepID=UPI0026EE8C0E|nr:TnsA endonuclease N-terminal domain-containing protein [Seleniivibrio woodruffii]